MFTRMNFNFVSQGLLALLALLILLPGCSPADTTTPPPDPTETSAPLATPEPTETTAPAATADESGRAGLDISLARGGLATSFQTETIAAVLAGSDAPYWEVLPEYTRLTLQGYPVSDHLLRPQLFIYPVQELQATNEGAAQIVASLQSLIQSPREIPVMPFLPLFNAGQVMHAHVQYLDFQNGQGLRYLTQFDQAVIPINNFELIYTYQGLTSDGQFYVAAVLPVTHPSLPATADVTGNEPPEFISDFAAYLANVVSILNPQSANTFTPDLTQLDAMMSSLEIQ
jgi:hypothetical protein